MSRFPDFNVTRMPFHECGPCTEEGIRRLAYIVLSIEEDIYQREYIDALELLMIQAKRIKPDGYGADWPDEITPVEIEHVGRRGRRMLKVRWLHAGYDNCELCYDGKLSAMGKDGRSHKVDCPECCGSGKVERDPDYIDTDIDGLPWRLAA